MNVTTILPILQVVLTSANILILGFAFYKFLNKPHTDLETRVATNELDIREIKQSLLQGNDRFRHQKSTSEIMQICMLAIIDFELTFCAQTGYTQTDDLLKAKNLLREHLAKKDD